MTLYLELTGVKDLPHHITVYVEGSQSGPVYTRKASNLLEFNFTCSIKSILKIQVYGDHFERPDPNLLIGEFLFSSSRFIEENKWNPRLQNQDIIEFESQVFDKDEKAVGSLVFNVRYNKTQLYCGEKVSNLDTIPQRQPVPLYLGKCSTKNLFSYFDSGNEELEYNWCEKNYRDDTWD